MGCSLMRSFLPLFILALFFSRCGENDPSRDASPFKAEFRTIWDHATAYTLEVLDSMPANKLGTRPAEGSMSFRHQIFHLEENLHLLTDRYVLDKDSAFHPPHDSSAGKKDLRKRLEKAFDKVEKALKGLPRGQLRDSTLLFDRMKVPRSRVFLLMRDHMTHHRAQMIIALRKAGQEPPDYRGW